MSGMRPGRGGGGVDEDGDADADGVTVNMNTRIKGEYGYEDADMNMDTDLGTMRHVYWHLEGMLFFSETSAGVGGFLGILRTIPMAFVSSRHTTPCICVMEYLGLSHLDSQSWTGYSANMMTFFVFLSDGCGVPKRRRYACIPKCARI
jgi:hypothetical protein